MRHNTEIDECKERKRERDDDDDDDDEYRNTKRQRQTKWRHMWENTFRS